MLNKTIDIIKTLLGSSEIPRFEYALDPDEDEKPKCLKPTILPEIVNEAKDRAKKVLANQSKGKNRRMLILIIRIYLIIFIYVVREQRFISDINFLGPIEYVKAYDPFIYLIDGKAETEIEQYITEVHSFDEFAAKVKFFDDLGIEKKLTRMKMV